VPTWRERLTLGAIVMRAAGPLRMVGPNNVDVLAARPTGRGIAARLGAMSFWPSRHAEPVRLRSAALSELWRQRASWRAAAAALADAP